jgi:glutamate-1-semialdehyde 2,1-aminomutase
MITNDFTMKSLSSPPTGAGAVPNAAFIIDPRLRRPLSRPIAEGCRLTDEEGVVRIDFDMLGGSVLLGHAHPEVEAAVAGPAPAQGEVAAALASLLPRKPAIAFCAEESQALPVAVALARKALGRRRVAVWEPAGGLFNDAVDLAALLVDPLGMSPAQLRQARRTADACGAFLIFDEGVSSFRVHPQGAQGLGRVRPDLSVFGANIANGRPIGAIAGPGTLIRQIDPDDLPPARDDSLAAALATLRFLDRTPVAPGLQIMGAELQTEVEALVARAGASRLFRLAGDPTLPTPLFSAPVLEGLWMREMSARDLVVAGPHALCAAHGEAEVSALVAAYAILLPAMMARSMAELLQRPAPPQDLFYSVAPEGRA